MNAMYCPNCNVEYVVSARKCADCHALLVPKLPRSPDSHHSLPDPSEHGPDDFVEVFSAREVGDIAVVQRFLQAYEIEHIVADIDSPAEHNGIMVKRSQFNRAKKILNDYLTIERREQQRKKEWNEMIGWAIAECLGWPLLFLIGLLLMAIFSAICETSS